MSEFHENITVPGIATINHFRNWMTSNATRQRSYRTTIIEIGIDRYANNRREVKLRPLYLESFVPALLSFPEKYSVRYINIIVYKRVAIFLN